LFQAICYHIFTTLRVCVPATVQSWAPPVAGATPLPATVTIKLDFLRIRVIDNPAEVRADRGEKLLQENTSLKAAGELPKFQRVPIVYAGAGPGCNIRGPIAKGTTGLYIVADRCIDQWLNTGGPLDPATADKHNINDGFFLPVTYHGKNSPQISADVHQVGPDDGSAGMEIATGSDNSIRLFTDGPTANIDAATAVQLGNALGPLLAVARQTDDVGPKTAMTAWALVVETAINTLIPGTFTPANSFATTVNAGNGFGTITSGSAKVQAE
jgi:hypothetical protein